MYEKNFFLSRYGEVFWQMMDPVPLDPDLVAKFNDKTMAIVGYESNQVQLGNTYILEKIISNIGNPF